MNEDQLSETKPQAKHDGVTYTNVATVTGGQLSDIIAEQREGALRGAQILARCLQLQGVDVLFGYPGGANLEIFDVLPEFNIRCIRTEHEQGAVHAAQAYARVSGKVGVCLATSGPGATNLVTGIADANSDSTPIVAITGNVPSHLLGKNAFQEVDIVAITAPVTKKNYLVKQLQSVLNTWKEVLGLRLKHQMHLKEKKMLIREIISEKPESKPIVYLDMDGVLADFFSEWAKLAGIKTGNYKDIPSANIDPTLDKMIGTDFFAQLPKFSTADKLIQMVINRFGSYKILSSPLRNDHENSKKHKIDWIGRKLKIKPTDIIIVGDKTSYARQADGTPNILIDDLGKNIQRWQSSGGLGIKYQADEDPLSKVQQWLSQFKKGRETQQVATERQEHIFEKDGAVK